MRTVIVVFLCIGVALAARSKLTKQNSRRQAGGCVYNGATYQQGQTWRDGCKYDCNCQDGATGKYVCTDVCPTYQLPPGCHLETVAGQCCGQPKCQFQTSMTGTDGHSQTVHIPSTVCMDKINDCTSYGTDICTNAAYAQWVGDNCCMYCSSHGFTMTGTGGTMTGTGTGGTMTGTGTGGTMTGTGTGGTMTGTGTGGTMTGTGTGGSMTGGDPFQLIFNTGGTTTCADTIPNCSAYDPSTCHDANYHDWAAKNCAKTCNMCGGSTSTGHTTVDGTHTSNGCVDKIPNCASYTQSVCTDMSYATWVAENCPHYCNKCGGTMTGPGTGIITGQGTGSTGVITGSGMCTDKVDCHSYAKSVCTDAQYMGWAKDNCPVYCNLPCGTMTGGTGTITGGTGTITGGTGTMTGTCADKTSNCAMLQQSSHICTDAGAHVFAQENCALTCGMCTSTGTYPMPGTGGTGTIITGTGSSGTCTDAIPNCKDYEASICTSPDYHSWTAQNCAHHCNMCGGTGMITGTGTGGTMTGTGTGGTMTGTGTGGTMTGTGTGTHTGGGITGTSQGCVYNNQVYQQGQTWRDACKFECSCVDASTGKYQCNALCPTWNLPPQCHMNPPAAGMCCETPSCPAGIDVQYPPNYVPK